MKFYYSLFILLLLVGLAGCSAEKPIGEKKETIEITISSAASLKDVLNEIKPLFEKEHDDIRLLFNFAGSGKLQQQIIQGAPVDFFVSASEEKFDELVTKGLIDKEKKINLLGNSLVLIVPKDSLNKVDGFEDLTKLGDGKIAIGTPESVPAGQYSKQTLRQLDLWERTKDNIVPSKDVRQVLTYVETGNVEAGIVYKTDAMVSDKVKIVAEAEPDSHDPIIYPAGIVNSSERTEEAELFLQFLQEQDIKEAFQKFGFNVLD